MSNASPLINLARIGRLDLLRELYGELMVPEAVWQEVVVEGAGQPGADEIKTAAWITTQPTTNKPLVRILRQELDAGESEAIVLALEVGAELLLMDERLGRELAQYLGVRCIGLIGSLVAAKRKQLIPAIKPYLGALRNLAGFRISDTLYVRVLQDEGEA